MSDLTPFRPWPHRATREIAGFTFEEQEVPAAIWDAEGQRNTRMVKGWGRRRWLFHRGLFRSPGYVVTHGYHGLAYCQGCTEEQAARIVVALDQHIGENIDYGDLIGLWKSAHRERALALLALDAGFGLCRDRAGGAFSTEGFVPLSQQATRRAQIPIDIAIGGA